MQYTKPMIVASKSAAAVIQGVEATKGQPTNIDSQMDPRLNTTPAYEADE